MEKRETAHGPAAWPGMIGGGNRNLVFFCGRGNKGVVTRRVEKGGSVCFERLKRREKLGEEREKRKQHSTQGLEVNA